MASINRTKRFFKNSAVTGLYQIAALISGFVVPKILLVYYGSAVNGLVSSIMQFVSYLVLVEAGLSFATLYALYKPIAEDNHDGINAVVSASRKFYIKIGWIFTGLMLCLAIFYPMLVNVEGMSSLEVGSIVLALGMYSAFEFFTLAKYRTLLTADQRTYVVSWASMVYKLCYVIIIYVLARLGFSALLVTLFAMTSILARSAVLYFYVSRKYKFINYHAKPNKQALSKRWDAMYLQILGAVQKGSPAIILTVINRDLLLVSVFVIFNAVLQGVNTVLEIFKSGLSASFGDVIAKGEKDVLQRAYSEFELCYYALITIVYSVSWVMMMPFIRIYTAGITDTNYDIPWFGFLLVLNGLMYNLKTPQGMLIISAGLYQETRIQASIQAGIVLLVSGICGYYWGLFGIMIGMLASNIYRNIDLLFFIPKHITGLSPWKTLYRWIYFGAVFIVAVFGLSQINLNMDNYLQWIGTAAMVTFASITAIVLTVLLFERKSFFNVCNRLKNMLSKRN